MAVKSFSLEEPGVAMVLIHPGWVDTDMGSAGSRKAPVSVQQSAEHILQCAHKITIEDTGKFVHVITGEELPW